MKKIDQLSKYPGIIIYGAGRIGEQVFALLEGFNLESKIKAFAVSDELKFSQKFEIKVEKIDNLKPCYKSALFIIAVAGDSRDDVIKKCGELGIKHYVTVDQLFVDGKTPDEFIVKGLEYKEKESGHCSKKYATHMTVCMVPNAGDTMLSYCVRHYMNFPGWNIEDIREVVTNEVIKKANNTKIVVIGGGGLFLPDTNENAISGWQWPISKELLQQFDVPIIVFSVGYNYFYGQKNTSLFEQSVTALVEKARFVGLRNKGSVRHIREFLPDMLKDKIVYQPCTTTLISKFMNITREYDTKKIVFNIAFDRSERRYINGKRKFILSQIAKSARMIEEIGYEILYVAHCDTDLFFYRI